MIFAGLIKSSLVDFPGNVSAVLFVPGCNFNCFYCHNRQLLDGTHTVIETDEINAFLEKRAGTLDGIVITGGEPTLYPDLPDFISWAKSLGYKIKLDTNGSNPDMVAELLKENLCDYYAVDYKAPKTRYKEICGENADPEAVLKTINLLSENGAQFEVRTTVCPGLERGDLFTMKKELPTLPHYVLNRYRQPENYLKQDEERIFTPALNQAEIDELVEHYPY